MLHSVSGYVFCFIMMSCVTMMVFYVCVCITVIFRYVIMWVSK